MVGQCKGSYFLIEPSWDSMLGRSWVLNQLGCCPLVIKGGLLVPRKALFEIAGNVNTGGGRPQLEFLLPLQSLSWGQLLCVLGQGLKPALDGLDRIGTLLFTQAFSRLWNVMHRELRAGCFEKETEATLGSGLQRMISRTLWNCRCSGTSLYWDQTQVMSQSPSSSVL